MLNNEAAWNYVASPLDSGVFPIRAWHLCFCRAHCFFVRCGVQGGGQGGSEYGNNINIAMPQS